jgi:polysaccharide pyruvyl transferase CsaB
MPTVALSGSYGGLNLGDEAILTCAIEQLRESIADVEILAISRNAEHTRANHHVDRVLPARTLTREELEPELRGVDLFLLGGGGLLYDGEASSYLREVRVAQDLAIPTMTFAIGAGPLTEAFARAEVRVALDRMAARTLREGRAKRLLEEVGVEKELVVTGDPALLLQAEPFTEDMLRAEGIAPGQRLVGMSVREPGDAAPDLRAARYHELVADAADFIVERFDAGVVFVPMERGDIREAHKVLGSMANADCSYVLKGQYSPGQVLGLMDHLELAVGMRLHFVIFAALASVPVLALPYAPKVTGMLDAIGLPGRVLLHEDRPGPLLAQIDLLWDHRAVVREILPVQIADMQAGARRTAAIARSVIGGGDCP